MIACITWVIYLQIDTWYIKGFALLQSTYSTDLNARRTQKWLTTNTYATRPNFLVNQIYRTANRRKSMYKWLGIAVTSIRLRQCNVTGKGAWIPKSFTNCLYQNLHEKWSETILDKLMWKKWTCPPRYHPENKANQRRRNFQTGQAAIIPVDILTGLLPNMRISKRLYEIMKKRYRSSYQHNLRGLSQHNIPHAQKQASLCQTFAEKCCKMSKTTPGVKDVANDWDIWRHFNHLFPSFF